MLKKEKEKEISDQSKSFQQKKISLLNRFFMKNIIIGNIIAILVFFSAVGFLVLLIFNLKLESDVRITLISMTVTYILTTSKTLIDKTIATVHYLFNLLCEEQRGLSEDLGIEIEKIDFESNQEE